MEYDVREYQRQARLSGDKDKLKELVEHDDAYKMADEDAYDMMILYTKATELLKLKNNRE